MNAAKLAGIRQRLLSPLTTGIAVACAVLTLTGTVTPAHAAPPAGTPIGNRATATYTDAASNSYTITSNPVTTIVQQVASFTLTADGARTAAPGGQASFPHILTNVGNGADTFPLTLANLAGDNFDLTGLAIYIDANGNGVPDNFTPVLVTPSLAPGAAYRFVVVGSVPGTQVGGDLSRVRISALSSFDNTQTAFNTDVVTVTGNAVLSVTKGIDQSNGASPSGPRTYTISYTNSGNAAASALRITDVIPAGMTYVPGSARWSATGAGTPLTDADSTDAQGINPNTVRFDYNIATAGAVTAQINNIPSGQSGSLTFQVNVSAALAPQTINNSARYAYNDGAGNVGPFFTNLAPFTVNQAVTFSFTGQTIASALQGSTVTFTNQLVNTGNGSDVFDIAVNTLTATFPAGWTYQLYQSNGVALLNDTNANGIPDTGPLASGASYSVILKVTLPTGATGGPYSVDKVATSVSNPGVSRTATDVLTLITANTVDLTNNTPLPGAPGAGAGPEAIAVIRNTTNPGTTTRFTLVVNNTSAQADNFAMTASTDNTFGALSLPAGWTVTFRDAANSVITSTGAIAAGGNSLVYADVFVANGTPAGDVALYFRARSAVSGSADRIHDAVGVNVVRSLALVPNNSAQVIPGGFVVYAHLLSNTGNVTEGNAVGSFIAISRADDQAGWSSAVYWDANGSGIYDVGDAPLSDLSAAGGLAPGASVRLFVQVFSPAGAPLGQLNTTTISATTSNVAFTNPVPALVQATDGTTVINGQLTISKRQALDGDCNGIEDAAFTSLNLTTGAIPGACIRYEITVTNIGSTPVTAVVINDATPANTTSSNLVSASTSVGTITVPANGSAGVVTANIGVLGPGQSAVIRFNVRIDYP